MASKVTVLALIQAKSGREKTVKMELLSLLSPTRSEAGCINYDLHQSTEDSSLFMFYENWTRRQDLEKHLQMPYLRDFRRKADDLLARPVEIKFFQQLEE